MLENIEKETQIRDYQLASQILHQAQARGNKVAETIREAKERTRTGRHPYLKQVIQAAVVLRGACAFSRKYKPV